jgi:K+-sensing histidine kinase KdpD
VEEEFNRVINALPGPVWTALPDVAIDFLNKRWCEYTVLDVEEAGAAGWAAVIHPEDLSRLLERWQSILVSGEAGMEMGLSVSRSIIESHHGQLWASANDGPGATFPFSIPQAPEGKIGNSSLGAIQASTPTDPQSFMRNP